MVAHTRTTLGVLPLGTAASSGGWAGSPTRWRRSRPTAPTGPSRRASSSTTAARSR
jgi:hypothetical protein